MSPLYIAIVLVVILCAAWPSGVLIKKYGFRFQFSLRSLLAVTGLVALVLGLISIWPKQVLSLNIPRIEAKPGLIDLSQNALILDISRRWGHTAMRVTPLNNFGEKSRAELFWLDSGNLRHAPIADKGHAVATTFSRPNEWPLLIGVVEWHPKAIHVVARWVLADGRSNGADVLYDANEPSVESGIEKWGQSYLERIRKTH